MWCWYIVISYSIFQWGKSYATMFYKYKYMPLHCNRSFLDSLNVFTRHQAVHCLVWLSEPWNLAVQNKPHFPRSHGERHAKALILERNKSRQSTRSKFYEQLTTLYKLFAFLMKFWKSSLNSMEKSSLI